jgi:hypothetical protein
VTTAYPPLYADHGVLVLGSGTLTPEGLACGERTFGWGGGWSLHYSATPGPLLALGLFVDDGGDLTRLTLDLMAPHPFRVDHVRALVAYLHDTPAARPGLADPARVAALLDALDRGRWSRRHLPHEPRAGDAHDRYRAVRRAVERAWPRRWGDRPVAGEPVPDAAAVVAAARAGLPARLRDRWSDDDLAAQVAPYLAVEPWPFSVLL